MALIPCPECGRSVSDQASACPQCGHPIAAGQTAGRAPRATSATRGAPIESRESVSSANPTNEILRGVGAAVLIVGALLPVLSPVPGGGHGLIDVLDSLDDISVPGLFSSLGGAHSGVVVALFLLWLLPVLMLLGGAVALVGTFVESPPGRKACAGVGGFLSCGAVVYAPLLLFWYVAAAIHAVHGPPAESGAVLKLLGRAFPEFYKMTSWGYWVMIVGGVLLLASCWGFHAANRDR